jgi:hypothetical protein
MAFLVGHRRWPLAVALGMPRERMGELYTKTPSGKHAWQRKIQQFQMICLFKLEIVYCQVCLLGDTFLVFLPRNTLKHRGCSYLTTRVTFRPKCRIRIYVCVYIYKYIYTLHRFSWNKMTSIRGFWTQSFPSHIAHAQKPWFCSGLAFIGEKIMGVFNIGWDYTSRNDDWTHHIEPN